MRSLLYQALFLLNFNPVLFKHMVTGVASDFISKRTACLSTVLHPIIVLKLRFASTASPAPFPGLYSSNAAGTPALYAVLRGEGGRGVVGLNRALDRLDR